MCGICAEVFTCSCHTACASKCDKIPELLLNRGPDASSCITLSLPEVSIVLKGTVLWLQGVEPVTQPIRDTDGNVLLFNGDVLAGSQRPDGRKCDSVHLLQQLQAAEGDAVPAVMSGIIGPWAFIYWRAATQCLYFGRDVLGRHSLLWSKTKILQLNTTDATSSRKFENDNEQCIDMLPQTSLHSPSFVVSSVGFDTWDLEEVPAKGIFVSNLKDLNHGNASLGRNFPLALVPWNGKFDPFVEDSNVLIMDKISCISPISEDMNMTVSDASVDCDVKHFEGNILDHLGKTYIPYTKQFSHLLQRAVQRRVDACPPCCVRCTQTRAAHDICLLRSSENDLVANSLIAAQVDFLSGNNDNVGSSDSTADSRNCGCASRGEHECNHIGINKPETTRGENIHDPRYIPNRSRTPDEVEGYFHYSTNDSKAFCDESCQQYDSSSNTTGGEGLRKSVENYAGRKSACKHCRIAVLFSGGLDSAMIAYLLDRCMPKEESIDLINVAFPATKSKTQIKVKQKKVRNKSHENNISNLSLKSKETCQKLESETFSKNSPACSKDEETLNSGHSVNGVETGTHSPVSSIVFPQVPSGTQNTREYRKCEIQTHSAQSAATPSQAAKLSSGSSENGSDTVEEDYDVPDRCTGRQCLEQLRSLCPDRHWNFIEVNVSREELNEHRAHRIRSLLRPHNTVLDDSIGCALWFAGRARGAVNGEPYTSTARVLLCGHGADEQLCGYSRHRSVYSTGGIEALLQEIRMEVERLPSRNLGRDDRVLADSARAPRFPYLDEDVVSYLNSLPIWVKADLRLPRGVGEKLLLRIMAHQMGLTVAAGLPKRAIQFGSRIAKMDDRKEKGDQVCGRLLNG